MVLEVSTTLTDKPIRGNISIDEFLPRNSTATSFFAFNWDGICVPRQGQEA